TFAEAVAMVRAATSFADLTAATGDDDGVRAYRRLVRIVHPDAAPAGETSTATAAFAKLATLWAERDGWAMTTRRSTYRVGRRVATGDLADLYAVDGDAALLKLPRRAADNDLLSAEATTLTRLRRAGDPKYRPYA